MQLGSELVHLLVMLVLRPTSLKRGEGLLGGWFRVVGWMRVVGATGGGEGEGDGGGRVREDGQKSTVMWLMAD